MIRTTLKPNTYRACPLPSTSRLTPVPYSEDGFYVSQGRAKRIQLGQTVYPFENLFVRPADEVTQIRYTISME